MDRLIALVQALLVATGISASAQEPQTPATPIARPVSLARFVPTAEERTLGFYTSINPDCTQTDRTVVRIIAPPEHGTASFHNGDMYTSFPRENPRSACNDKRIPGALVKYKSEDGYIGGDTFRALIIYPDGTATEATYNIVVR